MMITQNLQKIKLPNYLSSRLNLKIIVIAVFSKMLKNVLQQLFVEYIIPVYYLIIVRKK